MNKQIDPDDLEFVSMNDDAEMTVPDGTSFTGFKPGQKLLHLTELGGQPQIRIVTFEKEAILGGGIGSVVYVREYSGHLEDYTLYTLESIQDMVDDYTEKDARRWRAIHDSILPAVQLSNDEIDKIIDDNEEWCAAYKNRQREWSLEDVEIELLDQIPEDQRHEK